MQDSIQQTQVIIIGSGPTGLSMAAQLLRYNIDFVLLDKKDGPTELSKAVVVQARTLEILEELGLADKAIKDGRLTTGINLYYKGKRRASMDIEGLGDGMSAYPFALSLEQSKTEKLLVDHLTEQGRKIHWQCDITRFAQYELGVAVYYKDKDGQQHELKGKYLVGADGASSMVRHELGLPFEGDTVPKIFYVADVILSSPVICRDDLYMFMIKKGFVLFFPMEGKGHYRVIGIIPGATDVHTDMKFADIAKGIVNEINIPVTFDRELWFSAYRVHSRKADTFDKGRCFIAGDAAHIHTPAGGQGMNTGIQDAYNLAWKMALTLHNEVKDAVLASYSMEREQNARHLLKTTDRMFDFMTGTNAFWNFMRLNFFPAVLSLATRNDIVRKRFFPMLSQIGIAYPDSPLTIDSSVGKMKAGDRMPYFKLENGSHIFEHLASPSFKLLFFGSENRLKDFNNQTTITVETHYFKEIPAVFGSTEYIYVLLRPDNHISYIGQDAVKCKDLLQRISCWQMAGSLA